MALPRLAMGDARAGPSVGVSVSVVVVNLGIVAHSCLVVCKLLFSPLTGEEGYQCGQTNEPAYCSGTLTSPI